MIDAITQPGNKNGLRVIKTAKTIEEINEAAREGYRPLVRKIEPSDEIRHKLCMIQSRKTGEVKIISDLRSTFSEQEREEWEVVLPFFSYYSNIFPNPYAAYLIPEDILVDEKVFVEEVIEDIVNFKWQGNGVRLKSAEALWDGKDLKIIDGQAFDQQVTVIGSRIFRNKIIG